MGVTRTGEPPPSQEVTYRLGFDTVYIVGKMFGSEFTSSLSKGLLFREKIKNKTSLITAFVCGIFFYIKFFFPSKQTKEAHFCFDHFVVFCVQQEKLSLFGKNVLQMVTNGLRQLNEYSISITQSFDFNYIFFLHVQDF